MIRIYIVEDDINMIRILKKIIEDRNLGNLIGYATDGLDGANEVRTLKPDIVLVDLLMPGKDGINLVAEVKQTDPEINFIMLSQVISKDMIAKAYEKGIEYYINKPINAIEVESVIRKVIKNIEMSNTLSQIKNYFIDEKQAKQISEENEPEHCLKEVMIKIGIMGESGSKDILLLTKYLIENNVSMTDYSIKNLCSQFTDHPKSMEQRIRRTAQLGFVNLANLGIEDYMNENFNEYAGSLYSFEQVKKEMDHIRGKNKVGGKINLKKFLEGLSIYCENKF